jgi:aspartate kinase
MALVVRKYGRTSVGNLDKTANVARKVLQTKEEGNDLVVMAGFHGVDRENNITTQGKGCDTGAVALAAALKFDIWDIYTTVDGVCTTKRLPARG